MQFNWKYWFSLIGLICVYVLLGNARGVQANPFMDGASVAVNMIIPVLAGMLLGMRAGASVGFFGTLLNALSPAGSLFEFAAIIPHTAMGMVAGYLKTKGNPSPTSALSIIVGHVFNTVVFLVAGLISFDTVTDISFWQAITGEVVFAALTVLVVYKLIKLIQEPIPANKKKTRTASLQVGVWKILAAITIILTGLFIVFFSFPMISVTLVIGAALLMLADKLRMDFDAWTKEQNITGVRKTIYGHALWIFWAVVIVTLTVLTITNVTGAITDLGTREAADYIEPLKIYLPEFITDYFLTERAVEQIESVIFNLLAQVLSNASTFMINAIIIIPLMFVTYFRSRHQISESFSQFIPEKIRVDVMEMTSRITKQLKTFTSAKLIESLIVGLICIIGFFVAGIEGFLLLGLLAGLLNIIPYVGPLLGAIPALLLATTQAPIATLIVLITVLIAQLIDNLYLQPFMISGQVEINPLLSVILTLLGAQALGVLGMLFAIPVYLIYKLVLGESHRILVSYSK
jgi:predicted PurR-regulated permease PerM